MSSSLRGIFWTGLEKFLVYAVGFVQGIVLARLLSPHDFGLAAMLAIFLAIGSVLAESGFGAALVADGGRFAAHERRAFIWNLVLALVLYLALALIAPCVADWYGIPVLSPLMRVMALGLPINAAAVVAIARLTREKCFRRLAWVNSLSMIAGCAVAIALACRGAGVWSIVVLGLVTAVLRTVLAWLLAPRSTFLSTTDSFSELLALGAKMTVSSLLYTAYANVYQLVIGKLFSPAVVGIFTRAQRWSHLPVEFVNESVGRVAFVEFSQQRKGLVRFTGLGCALLWPILGALWFTAEPLVVFVLGAQWSDCVPLLRILIIGAFFSPIGDIAYRRITASGRGNIILADEIIKRVVGISLLAIGCCFGISGLCWSLVAHDIATALIDAVIAWRIARA